MKKGMTFLEWLVIAAILAILGAITWPVFQMTRPPYRHVAPTAVVQPEASR